MWAVIAYMTNVLDGMERWRGRSPCLLPSHLLRYGKMQRMDFMHIRSYNSKNAVTDIAAIAAAASTFFVPPDAGYFSYFDIRTIACLFCLLAIVQAFRGIGAFNVIARAIIRRFRTLRSVVLALVVLTLVASPFITNDMALIMFLPLTALVLLSSHNERMLPFTFTMQALAANLGGMLLPFGNPQNIFLNSHFGISFPDFIFTMAPSWAASVLLIIVCCIIGVKSVPVEVPRDSANDRIRLPRKRVALYLLLFVIALCMVFRVVHPVVGAVVVAAALVFVDRSVFKRVDYGLLLTFVFFFVFSGNMARIPGIQEFLTALMGEHALLTSALTSQIISNVPAAILLAPFTDVYQGLLIGVNIGGAGTLVASLASLIAFNQFRNVKSEFGHIDSVAKLTNARYVGLFSLYNFAFLLVLVVLCLF